MGIFQGFKRRGSPGFPEGGWGSDLLAGDQRYGHGPWRLSAVHEGEVGSTVRCHGTGGFPDYLQTICQVTLRRWFGLVVWIGGLDWWFGCGFEALVLVEG